MKSNCLLLNVNAMELFLLRRSRCKPPAVGGMDHLFAMVGTLKWLVVFFDDNLKIEVFIEPNVHGSVQLCREFTCTTFALSRLQRVISRAANYLERGVHGSLAPSAITWSNVHVPLRNSFTNGNALRMTDDPAAVSLTQLANKVANKEQLYKEFCVLESEAALHFRSDDFSSFKLECNASRNRWTTVPCVEQTRVVLHENKATDYIHANWVNSNEQSGAFICAQGPLEETVLDFWSMIWEYKVPLIVMCTKPMDGKTSKCAVYWPEEEASEWSNPLAISHKVLLHIRNEAVEMSDFLITTRLRITNRAAGGESRELVHLLYLAWPDFGVPETTESVLALLEIYRKYRHRDTTVGPVVVHCSAGIGRTGTFVALEMITRCLDLSGQVNILQSVQSLRSQRFGAVETKEQYVFLHRALMDYARKARLL